MRKYSAASRNGAARLVRWLVLALVGASGGLMLGELAVGSRTNGIPDEVSSYSRLSANPDASIRQGDGVHPCPDCADSYGTGLHWRARRDARMTDEFREVGAVDVDASLPGDPVDDYRFGGRFPDPEPDDRQTVTQVEEAPLAAPTVDILPERALPPSGD